MLNMENILFMEILLKDLLIFYVRGLARVPELARFPKTFYPVISEMRLLMAG